jgi:hypothetical protein
MSFTNFLQSLCWHAFRLLNNNHVHVGDDFERFKRLNFIAADFRQIQRAEERV